MIALDVNVVISALRTDVDDHEAIAGWLQHEVESPDPVGVSDAVLTGALRILSNPRIFTTPTPLDRATRALTTFVDHPGVTVLTPGPRHWARTVQLCLASDARGNDVADAAHAALAIEHGAVLITKDRGFARFPGLRWRHPLT
jgi:uncharacterized protein